MGGRPSRRPSTHWRGRLLVGDRAIHGLHERHCSSTTAWADPGVVPVRRVALANQSSWGDFVGYTVYCEGRTNHSRSRAPLLVQYLGSSPKLWTR